jgi:CBS domain-containing protein
MAHRPELLASVSSAPGGARLGDLLPRDTVPIVHPDNAIDLPLRKLGGRPFLPVVHRAHPDRLVGIISREDVLRAYAKTGEEEVVIPGPT